MNSKQFLRALRFAAALLAALAGAGAIATDATGQKSAAALGQALAKTLNERNVDAFMRNVDTGAVIQVVLKDLGLSAADADALRQQLPDSMRRGIGLTMQSIEQAKGTARFLRHGKEEGRPYALVRVDMAEGGVDYIKYFISPRHLVEDWYVYTAAALFSTSVRFNLAAILKNDSLLYSLFGLRSVGGNDAKAFVKPFAEVRRHLVAGDYAAAYRALEDFPERYRKSRQWALMRVTYGGRAGDENYRAALRHLAANYGGDGDLQLVLIDHYFLEKQHDRALAGIAALEQAVGGEDASIGSLRGNLFTEMKRYPDAAKSCRRAMALEPDFKQGYWCLVTVGITSNDGKLAVEGLTAYEKAFRRAL